MNFVRTVFGKDSKEWAGNQITAGRLRYIDTEKAPDWFRVQGRQLPEWEPIRGPNGKVLTKADLVNHPKGVRELFAKGDGPQGSTPFFHQPGERVQAILNLFRGADKSTFAHESAHIWLEELRSWAAGPAAPDQFRRDLETVTKTTPTRRTRAASLGKMPTTSDRRLTSAFRRSMGLVEWILPRSGS